MYMISLTINTPVKTLTTKFILSHNSYLYNIESNYKMKYRTFLIHIGKQTPSSICIYKYIYILNMFQSKCRNNVDTEREEHIE